MPTNALIRKYRQCRAQPTTMRVGFNAADALASARTLLLWARLESAGLVRLTTQPDQDYDWRDLTDDDYYTKRQDMLESLMDSGAWGVVGEYSLDGENWEDGDSIWGCVGYTDVLSPFQNCYVIDIMDATIDALRTAAESLPQKAIQQANDALMQLACPL